MDDMKRAMYMEALRVMKKSSWYGSTGFICLDLNEALKVLVGGLPFKTLGKLDETLVEFFPEFFEFFDGHAWTQDGECINKQNQHNAWWEKGWLEPRIRILEFILDNR